MSEQAMSAVMIYRLRFDYFLRQVFRTLHAGDELVRSPYIETMCWHLQEVAEGRLNRLLVTVPPRHLKSICGAVGLVAWMLGRNPATKVLVASYGQDLAEKHSRDCLAVMQSPWYRAVFPSTRVTRPQRQDDFSTSRGGGRKAGSLGGAITGFGADIILIDDLMKARDAASPLERARVKAYFEETLFTRLNDKKRGRIVVLQQRLHEDDFAGYVLDKGKFTHLNLPSIADSAQSLPLYMERTWRRAPGDLLFPEREDAETLEQIRIEMGNQAFASQYLQNPVRPDGARVRWEWFGSYDELPPRASFKAVVQSWDTAMGASPNSDFSVCTTWGFTEGRWYLMDLYRARVEYPDLLRAARRLAQVWTPDAIIIEKACSGIPLIQDLFRERRYYVLSYLPKVDKVLRLEAQTAKMETGNYLLPKTAHWLEDFRRELLAFPNGRHDDQVDSLAQFLDWVGTSRMAVRITQQWRRPRGLTREERIKICGR